MRITEQLGLFSFSNGLVFVEHVEYVVYFLIYTDASFFSSSMSLLKLLANTGPKISRLFFFPFLGASVVQCIGRA